MVGILILLTWDCKIGFQWFSRVSCAWWQSDRFITDRSAMDFNIANYMLGAKENNCSVDSSVHSPSEVKALKIFSWIMNVETMYVVVPLSLSNKIVILCFSNELILSFTHTQPASFWNKWVLLLSNVYHCLSAAGVFLWIILLNKASWISGAVRSCSSPLQSLMLSILLDQWGTIAWRRRVSSIVSDC